MATGVNVKGSVKVDKELLILGGLGVAAIVWLLWVNFQNNDDDTVWSEPVTPEWLQDEPVPLQYGSGLPLVPGTGDSCVALSPAQLIKCNTANPRPRTYPGNLIEADISIMGTF